MHSSEFPVRKNAKQSYKERLSFAVSLCSLAGLVCIAIHILFLYIFHDSPSSFPEQYINDMIVYVTSMLLPALILGYLGNGVRTYFTPTDKKLPAGHCVLLVLFGFSGCIFFNDIVSILDGVLPQAGSATIYISPDFGSFFIILISSALFPAICEEVFFRGYIYSTLSRFGAGYAALVSALFFGLMHFSLTQMLFAFLCGFMFGYIRYISQNFILTVIVHFLNNALSTVSTFIRLTCSINAYQIYNIIAHAIFMLMLVGSATLLSLCGIRLLLFRKRKAPLSFGKKLLHTAASPAFLVFLAAAAAEKFI